MATQKITADDLINRLNEARPKAVPFVSVSSESKTETFPDVVFWKVTQKGKNFWLDVENSRLLDFLQSKGYYKIYVGKNPLLVKKDFSIFEEVSPTQVKDFVLNYVDSLPTVLPRTEAYTNTELKNLLLSKVAFFFGESFLYALQTIEFKKNRDTAASAFFYYANGFVEVNRLGIVLKPYSHLTGHIWRSQITDRSFAYVADPEALAQSEFCSFMYNVSGQVQERFDSLRSITGFLLHSYKSLSIPAAVILCDEVISENPEGGTGKGIYINGLKQLKNTATIEGKNFKFDKAFVWQRVSLDTQLINFDDVQKRFDFERLFSLLTEGISVEKKNMQEFYIPFDDAPKVIITTNYTIEGNGNSHERRKIEFEFAQYYNSTKTPAKEFGHLLFADWSAEEWNRFDNFMMLCVKVYLEIGLFKPNPINLKTRKLMQQTSEEFLDWCDTLSLDVSYEKKELYNQFKDKCPETTAPNKAFNTTKFGMWLRIYAKYNGRFNVIKEEKSGSLRWLRFLKVDNPD